MNLNILMVEDDASIRDIVSKYAVQEQFSIYPADCGKKALALFELREYALVLVDVMLPDLDGWTIVREIRKTSSVPIIMLTARGEESDVLFGFDLGVDDYITKPFRVKELMARIKTILKRNHTVSHGEIVTIGQLEVNTSFHQVSVNAEVIELTPLEYKLLLFLINNRNFALSRNQLLDGVWGFDYFGDERTVDTHVKRLRHKLGVSGDRIQTVRGIGYKLIDSPLSNTSS